MEFRTIGETEAYLEKEYLNKVVMFKEYKEFEITEIVGKVDRISIDNSRKPSQVVLMFNDNKMHKFDVLDFLSEVIKLN